MNFWLSLSKKTKIILSATILLIIVLPVIYLINKNIDAEEIIYKRGAPVLLSGAQTYEIVQYSLASPRARLITIDPLDAKPGDVQKFKIAVESAFTASGASIDLEDGSDVVNIKLEKDSEGGELVSRYFVGADKNLSFSVPEESPSSTISYWSGERVVGDTAGSSFSIVITAKEHVQGKKVPDLESNTTTTIGNFDRLGVVNLAWDRACEIPFGGDWEFSDSCVVSHTDGVDSGNAHIANGSSLILDADFGINSDKSIIFQPLGVVAVNLNAKLLQGNIWKVKSDATGIEEVVSPEAPSWKHKRRSDFDGGIKNFPNKTSTTRKKISLPAGRQTFQIASAERPGPKIIQADIDPLDVQVGDVQKLSLIVQSNVSIDSVLARIETDNGIVELPLALEGPAPSSVLIEPKYAVDGNGNLAFLENKNTIGAISGIRSAKAESEGLLVYSGSWIVQDTHTAKYRTSFIIKDSEGVENSILMAWTDPCGTFVAGARSLNTCSFSDIDGADNGNLTINTNQTISLLNGATLVFNSGRTVVVNGTIAVATGAQIRKTNLWRTDADGDSWAASASFTAQDTQPAGKVRAYLAPNSSDCYDLNASAYPGSGVYYQEVNRGDGSFDYNCDGWESIENSTNLAVECYYNGTNYPTNTCPYCVGWCDLVTSGAGGVNYPYCSGSGYPIPGCGSYGNFYWTGGCEYGQYGGVVYSSRIQGCK